MYLKNIPLNNFLLDIKFLAKGHRAIVYTAYLNKKKVAVKVERRDITAKGRIENEANWLKILNEYDIGPKLIKSSKEYLVYEFVEGKRILDWLKEAKNVKKILKEIFNQCRILDKLHVDKLEMHHPIKHILIDKSAVMIDFERCKKSEKPKNVTGFSQFLMSKPVSDILRKGEIIINKDKLICLLKAYKKGQTDKDFMKILDYIF